MRWVSVVSADKNVRDLTVPEPIDVACVTCYLKGYNS